MEEWDVVSKDGYQFTRDGSMVLVQKVMDDGNLCKGILSPLFGWNLEAFASEYQQLKKLEESDALSDLREAQWEADEFAREESYEAWLTGGML